MVLMALFCFLQRQADACITTVDGKLENGFRYLESLMKRVPRKQSATGKTMIISLEGHLFDSGLINQVFDVIESNECGVDLQRCVFPPRSTGGRSKKSAVLLRVTSSDEAVLSRVESKIGALVDVIEKAEAAMVRVDHGRTTSQRSPASVQDLKKEKKVLLLGAGRVSRSLVDLLGRSGDKVITVVADNEEEARGVASVAEKGRHVGLNVKNDLQRLSELIEGSDIVISLLPAPMHPPVALECIMHKKDFVTASYESEEMRAMNDRAKDVGIIILNEVGLDPGLDHMSAMKIIDDIKSRGGTVTCFSSVCGGLPAPEAADNPLKYKFSWSPKGVISASQNDARYRWEGKVMEVRGHELLQSAAPFVENWPDLHLECLPNRDSLHYEKVYSIAGADTIFRGTLRYRGFSSLMNVFRNMGLFDTTPTQGKSWEEVINMLRNKRGGFLSVNDFVQACAEEDLDEARRAIETLEWLGILAGNSVSNSRSVVDAFCDVLESKLQYQQHERDMVAMHHTIEASFENGSEERHYSSLQVFGDPKMTAMSKTVGYTAAVSADLILSGSLRGERGLLLPTVQKIYEPVLAALDLEGVSFEESVSVSVRPTSMRQGGGTE
jgi:alpha-aminoadipic semialdehyde synthase